MRRLAAHSAKVTATYRASGTQRYMHRQRHPHCGA